MSTQPIPPGLYEARFQGVHHHAVFQLINGKHHGEKVHVACESVDDGYAIARLTERLVHGNIEAIATAESLKNALASFFFGRESEQAATGLENHLLDDREQVKAAAEVATLAIGLIHNHG